MHVVSLCFVRTVIWAAEQEQIHAAECPAACSQYISMRKICGNHCVHCAFANMSPCSFNPLMTTDAQVSSENAKLRQEIVALQETSQAGSIRPAPDIVSRHADVWLCSDSLKRQMKASNLNNSKKDSKHWKLPRLANLVVVPI